MLTESRIGNYSPSREAAMPMGSPCIVGQRCILGRDDPHVPPGKPLPHHPLAGRLHTWRPTAKPGG